MITTIIFVLVTFILLIIPHELGHFLLAKSFGMQVDRFSFGMGPKLIGFKRGETEYTLSLIPVGGFVKIRGMQSDERNLPGSFYEKPLRNRILVLLSGSAMNYLVAIILFSVVFMIGFHSFNMEEAVINEVKVGSPAALASLLPGDEILAINGEEIEGWEGVSVAIKENIENDLKLTIQREGRIFDVQIKPAFDPQLDRMVIGVTITPSSTFVRYNFVDSLLKGSERVFVLTGAIFSALGGMIIGRVPAQFTGPVGIAQFIGESAKMGMVPLLSLIAFLSVNLGLFNLFPIPALDGGRLLFLLIEGVRGKPLDLKKEELVHYIGFIILFSLFFLVTYQDILRWVGR